MAIHLSVVMALGTCPRAGAIWMALRANTVGTTVIHRERVNKSRLAPIRRVMALTTLACEVIGRRGGCVARNTIRQARVIHVGRLPGGRRVAQTALPCEVIGRFVGCVTRDAIR